MFDLSAYALRFLEYLVLMVLFGVPLFGWYGSRRSALADALAGWPLMGVLLVSATVGLVLTGADVVFKTAGIMGMPVADVDRGSLGWYLLETSAGRAAIARGALLLALMFVLGWHRRRGKVELAFPLAATLAGGALASLAWNGHAAAGEGVAGAVRLAAGLVHLLAAGGWIAAVLMFLGMLLRGKEASGSGRLRSTHDFLHGFSTLGTIFVAALVVSGIAHYGDLTAWSFSSLLQSTYGNLLLFKLALFGGMLGLGALHRWTLVPRLGRALTSGDPAQEVRALRQSVAAEAALATLILIVVSVLGTLSPV
ncbi:transporter [Lysobacter concretionis Ko07 = DSM 16239]|uniref:Copper resistance protein D n=1 Tax=Lysobacter concretionis Ko07 = DSM 16239 TaxID=1122185 RepID=A0A0A0EMI6_9GAMM|nr:MULTISPECIES: copper homeostasis membrane protein CopD [Lysobacter]KGM51614.1 transporter [Lysobacter concretionis Ko07 = DSM 16239]QOD90007.1 copper homeostasis membrane protein CopD [Lysobacter sp. CW239]